jgi:PAS domain-containing protein
MAWAAAISWVLHLHPAGAQVVPAETAAAAQVAYSIPTGCKAPELLISRDHPLIILYSPGSAERTVKCWEHLPASLRSYCVVTMDPPALDLGERLAGWRRMLKTVQAHDVPIVLQVAGDEPEWTTPLAGIESLLREFTCIKAIQVVEWRCAYYTRFGGDLDMAIPANLRYLAEVLKLCGRYGKHLSLQIQTDMAHLACDQLAGPLREVFKTYRAYFLPQNECIPPSYYLAQTAALGFWLGGFCENWGMEPQWWWWTKGESYFIRPGLFGVEEELQTDEEDYAKLYRAFIIEGALAGATVFSIEPPQDIWQGEGTDPLHFDRVIYPTLRQIIEEKLIASREDVLARAKVAYQLTECKTIHQYDTLLQDLDLETAQGHLERAAYGALLPHLMKEMIPDTGGRYFFIPLLPVGTPSNVADRFAKVIRPGERTSQEGYRQLLNQFFPPTENVPGPPLQGRAFVLKCGRAAAVLQSRENLYEKQAFTVELPRWVTGLKGEVGKGEVQLSWNADSQARFYRVWKRIPGSQVYPQWELLTDRVQQASCYLAGVTRGTFAVTASTRATRKLEGTVNFTEYLLFRTDESPIVEQLILDGPRSNVEGVSWTNESMPARQEVWRLFQGVPSEHRVEAEQVLDAFAGLIRAFEAKDLDGLMSYYDPAYRDSNGYSPEYVCRAWQWWYQRTVVPYVVAQVRTWDTTRAADGLVSFTAWNRFRGTIVWDEPFGYHGRVRIPRHDGDRVTWTWRRNPQGEWKLLGTTPALPNFGEMLWIGRGHDVKHTMKEFADRPEARGGLKTP